MKLETQHFINKLEAFKKAASELATVWLAQDDERVSQAPNRLDPFKVSFEEVAKEIKEWVEDTRTRVITDSQAVFIVGEICLGGYLEVSWREGDNIMTFQSEAEAEAEIQDMLEGVKEAVKKGDMEEEYDREDYVILPARLDGDTLYFEYDDEHWKMGLLDERKTLI
ncbi:MAG: hypothetical protein IM631_12935 [Cytophagales bacterium]|nr:hypothetical protein [Cytophagales bacterium]MCA6372278.1 hypothetical protein [Cytophagales bacterium]MCA6382423.1 hypothetical protein [Cytophagales bacterium]